jgi:hypothetical protein
VIAGGLSQFIATGLFAKTGRSWLIAAWLIGMSAVTTFPVYLASETAHEEIEDSRQSLGASGQQEVFVALQPLQWNLRPRFFSRILNVESRIDLRL